MVDREKTAIVDLKVRMKESLRGQIENAAREKGVSLNAEAASRLEQSFDYRPLHAAIELAFGRELGGILLLIGQSMAMSRDLPKFFDVHGSEPWTYDQMSKAAEFILETFRPPEAIIEPTPPRYSTVGIPADRREGAELIVSVMNSDGRAMLNAGVTFATEQVSQLVKNLGDQTTVTRDLIGERLIARARNRSENQVAAATSPAAPNEPVSKTTVHARRRSRKPPAPKP